jgi:DNA-binding IclR family transcriptional regulator
MKRTATAVGDKRTRRAAVPHSPRLRVDTGRVTTHQSLERGLLVLETVATTGTAISLGETARRTGLHRSTAHHLLQSLVGVGYLRQDTRTRGYELTARLFELTGRMWSPEQLGELGQSFVAELTRSTGEGASLAAYRDGVVSIVAKRDSDGPVRVVQSVGAQRPIHATAVAKAIVAFLPDKEREGVLERASYEKYAPKTITSRKELAAELARVRAEGCAHDDEEHIEGIRCIAGPVFAYSGRVVASLCIVGPRSRMSRQRVKRLRLKLLEICTAMSDRLGHRRLP